MEKDYSSTWKSSVQPRKQRKYRQNAPLHIKGKFLGSHLSTDLRKKYAKRSARLRKGDKVKIMVGQFRGKIGKVSKVDIKKTQVFIESIDMIKKDGSKRPFGLHPSNLLIVEMVTDDKMRMKRLQTAKGDKQ